VQEHTQFLVNRLVKYSKIHKTSKTDAYSCEIEQKMKAIQEELMCVEAYVKENYPAVTELFDALKEIPLKEDHEN